MPIDTYPTKLNSKSVIDPQRDPKTITPSEDIVIFPGFVCKIKYSRVATKTTWQFFKRATIGIDRNRTLYAFAAVMSTKRILTVAIRKNCICVTLIGNDIIFSWGKSKKKKIANNDCKNIRNSTEPNDLNLPLGERITLLTKTHDI